METTLDPNVSLILAAVLLLPFPLFWGFCYAMSKVAEKMGSTLGMDTPLSFIPLRLWTMLRAKAWTSRNRQALRTLWCVTCSVSIVALLARSVPRSVWLYTASLVLWFAGIAVVQYFALWGKRKTQG